MNLMLFLFFKLVHYCLCAWLHGYCLLVYSAKHNFIYDIQKIYSYHYPFTFSIKSVTEIII